jgi:hypothetical protein
MTTKVVLKGRLFMLVEENPDNGNIDICIEIDGINIWDWFNNHKDEKVKITLESEEEIE